jgi:hypothetical protein
VNKPSSEGSDVAEAAQHETGALRSQDLKRVAVDFTAQPRAITFATELLHAAINGLLRLTRITAPSRLHLKPEV